MIRRLMTFVAACSLSIGPTLAQSLAQNNHHTPEEVDYTNWPGQSVDVFGARVVDVSGQIHRLGATNDVQPFVLIFLDRDCNVSNRYAAELNSFAELAAEAGVQFYGVVSESLMTAAEAGEYFREYGYEFPVIWDPLGDLAVRVDPTNTPEAFVISPEDEVLYRGRIDDRFASITVLRQSIRSHDLRAVIDALGKGAEIYPHRTQAVGCIFEALNERALPEQVTYARHIAPLLTANCAECHRDGSIAPFPLETYEQAKRRAKMMAFVTTEKIMPPWPAEKGRGAFRDERHLSDRQIATLAAWAADGVPEGDKNNLLPAPRWPSHDWLRGEPDLVIEMAEEFEVPAGGPDIYRYFVVPVEILQDQHIVGLEFRPGDQQAVHHSLVYIDYTGRARERDEADPEPGFSVFGAGGFMSGSDPSRAIYVGGWAPGINPLILPPGHGIPLQGRSGDAVFEIHYRPTGKPTKDRSRIGLYFAKEPITSIVASTVAGTIDVNIKPEDDAYWRQVYMDVPADIRLIGLSPHMHYLGREVKAVATLPDGEEMPLISIPDWNFRWQNVYMFREPLRLPAGTRITAWFKFDNSSENPANPHIPPGHVRWGWSSDEEMCELWMRFTTDDARDLQHVRRSGNSSWNRGAEVTRLPPW